MVEATFLYSATPPRTILLSRGYGDAFLAHQLVTMIMGCAKLSLLLDLDDEPVWIERDGLVGFVVVDNSRLSEDPPSEPR